MKTPRILRFPRIFRSVFTKLTLISLVTWLLLVIVIIATFGVLRHNSESPFLKHTNLYVDYLLQDLGTPSTRQKALELYRQTDLHISFIGNEQSWTTKDQLPDFEEVRFHRFSEDGKLFISRPRFGGHLIQLKTEDGRLYFEFAGTDDSSHQAARLILLVSLSVFLLASYFAIKRVLRPLKWLDTGVQQVKEGNLEHEVPVRGKDELAELGRNFNEMTSSLTAMLAAKEQLLRDISHELRSPLARMRIALELCEGEEGKRDIEEDIAEMEAMLAMLLEAAKQTHGLNRQNRQPCDLVDLVDRMVAKYGSRPPGVEMQVEEKPLILEADPQALQRLITNCLDNAFKFSGDGAAPIEVVLSSRDDSILLSIRDHGCGIAEADVINIFEPFWRVDASRSRKTGGFGLGLSIAKTVVEAHGGRIEARSEKGKGTTMIITLPMHG